MPRLDASLDTPTPFWTTRRLAIVCSVDRTTIARWIRNGQLPAIKMGHEYRVSAEDALRIMKEGTGHAR